MKALRIARRSILAFLNDHNVIFVRQRSSYSVALDRYGGALHKHHMTLSSGYLRSSAGGYYLPRSRTAMLGVMRQSLSVSRPRRQ